MKRREFIRSLCASAAAAGIASQTGFAGNSKKPNILFIFADDQCYRTLNALGNKEIETPNLDKLVKNGTLFTHAYNQGGYHGAVCVASRTMLNTGRFLWNAKACDDKKKMTKLQSQGVLWSQLMKKAGYETYMTGKWHIKAQSAAIFDHMVHERPGMPNQTKAGYNRPKDKNDKSWLPWDTKHGGFWKGGKHWSEVLGDDAEKFLENAGKSDKPFFMYLAFNAPHDPRQSPKQYVDKYPPEKIAIPKSFVPEYKYSGKIGCGRGLRDEKLAPFPRTEYAVKVNRQEYYAIITHMDAQIGRILEALEKTGKADNTYIFFTADHGLAVGHHGLMGKQNLFDHSVRVPLMVNGPDIAKDKKIDAPVYLQDIMPTSLELGGAEKPKEVQFKSLMPILQGKAKNSYDAIYGAYVNYQRSVTMDGHKLLLYPGCKKVLLFNLKDDPEEMVDISEKPESKPIIKKLFARLLELQKETGDTLDLKKTFQL